MASFSDNTILARQNSAREQICFHIFEGMQSSKNQNKWIPFQPLLQYILNDLTKREVMASETQSKGFTKLMQSMFSNIEESIS